MNLTMRFAYLTMRFAYLTMSMRNIFTFSYLNGKIFLWGDILDKNYLVTKSNYFIMNSSYDLSLEEQKLILTLASMVQPSDEEFKPYNFRIAEFMELLGVEDKSKYTKVPKITKELMKKVFEIQEGNRLIQTAWISGVIYEKGSGMVTLKFNPDLKPYMLQLKEKFTQYQLANVLTMKSKYSPRIYEILKCNEFKKQGYTEVEVGELRRLLKAENIYPLYADFKRFVLMQAQKELKALTDISFEYEEIKTGRKVTSIRFYIKSNKLKAIDEVSATIMQPEEVPGENIDVESGTRAVLNILKTHKVKPLDALDIYKNANGDIQYIAKVYEYSKTQNIKTLVGFMKEMVKPGVLQDNIKTSKTSDFNNFEQRSYDWNDLERKLLGWDNEVDENTGENYQQGTFNLE